MNNANECFTEEDNYSSESTGSILVGENAHSPFPL